MKYKKHRLLNCLNLCSSEFAERYGEISSVRYINLVADNDSQMQTAAACFQRSFVSTSSPLQRLPGLH